MRIPDWCTPCVVHPATSVISLKATPCCTGRKRLLLVMRVTRESKSALMPKTGVTWYVTMRPGKRRALNKENEADALIDQAEKLKAGIRAKVEHPFRVLKRQFGFVKVRYRGLKKNTAQLFTLFALSNLWMARSKLMEAVV